MDPTNTQAQAGGSTETAAKADSLITPGQEPKTLDERLKGATTPDDVRRLIDEAKEGRFDAPPNEEQAEKSPEPEAAELPTAKPEPVVEKPATPEEKAEVKTEDDDPEGKLPERIRLTNFSKVEKLAMQLKREDPKLTLAEAETRAKVALGVKDEPAPESNEAKGQPQTIAETDAKIAELRALRTKARTQDLDFNEADRLDNAIDALKDHRLSLRESVSQAEQAKRSAYDTAFDAAQAKAASLYDFVKQPESEEFKRMVEIDRTLEENGDPLFSDPEKPRVLAMMVAKEKAIAPKSATAKPVAKPVVAAPAQTLPKKTVPPVASGASRTTTATTQGNRLSEEIDAIRTPADMEKFLKKIGSAGG